MLITAAAIIMLEEQDLGRPIFFPRILIYEHLILPEWPQLPVPEAAGLHSYVFFSIIIRACEVLKGMSDRIKTNLATKVDMEATRAHNAACVADAREGIVKVRQELTTLEAIVDKIRTNHNNLVGKNISVTNIVKSLQNRAHYKLHPAALKCFTRTFPDVPGLRDSASQMAGILHNIEVCGLAFYPHIGEATRVQQLLPLSPGLPNREEEAFDQLESALVQEFANNRQFPISGFLMPRNLIGTQNTVFPNLNEFHLYAGPHGHTATVRDTVILSSYNCTTARASPNSSQPLGYTVNIEWVSAQKNQNPSS
ncbi:hypothetical protein O1611_g8132 [Lasiodiplodia mahajangana]|uniref:Uncharacterized protein n=1 Tax=Lasiodiplodia mahajangana TaxID=1108764 RepID=A0ACC2JDP0_9PEZI|nr:hypothetical protein O1611_g8132 [Lasiodiplodia mahajangana]